MLKIIKKLFLLLSAIRLIPHYILLKIHPNSGIIKYEVERWLSLTKINLGVDVGFITLMTDFPEFRNLFYYRIGAIHYLINFLCPKVNTLFITCPSIGRGLFIQHGFATIIIAKSIGNDCRVNQQVTVGYSKGGLPVIENNVEIKAGAKVIGGITIKSNCIVGANAVVVKNVPECCTVVGVPAYIIKRDGEKVKEKL
jgi:serine O-acetyltransferase